MRTFRKNKGVVASAVAGVALTLTYGILAFSQGSEDNEARAAGEADNAGMAGLAVQQNGDKREVFHGDFLPVNPSIGAEGGAVSGNASVIADQYTFGVALQNVEGLDLSQVHMAYIYKGPNCPTNQQDMNQDGYVDITEAAAADTGILINIDGNLSTTQLGSNIFPTSDPNGFLDFITTGNLGVMLGNLHRRAPNPATGIVTLAPNEKLDLNQAVVVVHGVDPSVQLPATVSTVTGLTSSQSLPVACAKLANIRGLSEPLPLAAASPSPSPSPSMVATPVPLESPTASPTPGESPTPTASPSPVETASPSPSPSPLETASPSPSPTPTETATPSPSPTPTETATPSPSPTPTETATPQPSPSPEVPSPSPSPSIVI